jgi:hypothetical protein
VIYEIDEEQRTVTILDIGHRREIYREESDVALYERLGRGCVLAAQV